MESNTFPKPKSFREKKASQAIGLLKAQGGFSLIEVLVVAVVLAVLILTIYMGVMYAEKQVRQNYRHRAATFIASGEIEKQYTLYMKERLFRPFTSSSVIIDETEEGTVTARLSVTTGRDVEFYVTKQFPLSYVTAEVSWTDPETLKPHKVRVREDFYDVEGGVNN